MEGEWKWTDGSPVTYTNWDPNEPNDDKDSGIYSADYVLMSTPLVPWGQDEYGRWNDHFNDPLSLDNHSVSGIVEISNEFLFPDKTLLTNKDGSSFVLADYQTAIDVEQADDCLLYTSPSPRDEKVSRMPSSA